MKRLVGQSVLSATPGVSPADFKRRPGRRRLAHRRLQDGIAKHLVSDATTASLEEALKAVGCQIPVDSSPTDARFAALLARHFFESAPGKAGACFNTVQTGVEKLVPRPALSHAQELCERVRPLWVRPEAAACLPRALHTKRSLALAGRFVTLCDSVLGTLGYTLEPYVERAWPSSGHLRFVTLAATRDLEDVRGELRRSVLGPDLPPDFEGKELDQMVNESAEEVDTTIVVLVAAGADTGGLPDPGLLRDLQALQACAN